MTNGQASEKKLLQNHMLYKALILGEQVKQIYGLAPIGFLATYLNSLIVYFVMSDVMNGKVLMAWLATLWGITTLRFAVVLWYRNQKEVKTDALWAKGFMVSLFFAGLSWGSIGFTPLTGITLAHQVFLAFVLGGMAAGASSTFSMLRFGYLAFSLPALLPLTIHFLMMRDNFHYAMGAMLTLFVFLLWRISLHNYRVNKTSLLRRYENLDMIQSLKQAKERLSEEIDAKHKAEAELRQQHEQLERIVEERTRDLLQTNEELVAAKEAAEAASIAKSEFLANMSHEMRTPLTGTLGMINLVLEMEIGEEEKELLQMARRSAESLLRIISDVLDFSRLEANVMRLDHENFSLPEVIRTAMEIVSLTAAEKGINLAFHLGDSVPEELCGDQGRLRQVLVNLLGNSVKFTETGSIELTVNFARDEKLISHLLFAVRDTGLGIPSDKLEHIFDKFTQIDSTRTRRHGGTGLGLALTRQIVEKWGGRIWAESRVGEGSTFYFTFPLAGC